MYIFLLNFAPRSINAKKKPAYYAALVNAFNQYNQAAQQLKGDLYGFAYYFHRKKTGLDADNLSKPIWDALKPDAYSDDKFIKLRSSAVFDLESQGIGMLDLSTMPDEILDDFLRMIDDGKDHIIYVEIGKLDYNSLRFGHEK